MPLEEVIAVHARNAGNARSNLVDKWSPFFNTTASGFVFVCACVRACVYYRALKS
jgi:hypothetical protein